MNKFSMAALSLFAMGISACGGSYECTQDAKAKDLKAPFNDMCLQIGDKGDIENMDSIVLAAWENDKAADVTTRLEEGIFGMGWEEAEVITAGAEDSDATIHTIKIYKKGDNQVGMLTGNAEEDGISFAYAYFEHLKDDAAAEGIKKGDGQKKAADKARARKRKAKGKKAGAKEGGKAGPEDCLGAS